MSVIYNNNAFFILFLMSFKTAKTKIRKSYTFYNLNDFFLHISCILTFLTSRNKNILINFNVEFKNMFITVYL